jgi:hypothetical protein
MCTSGASANSTTVTIEIAVVNSITRQSSAVFALRGRFAGKYVAAARSPIHASVRHGPLVQPEDVLTDLLNPPREAEPVLGPEHMQTS